MTLRNLLRQLLSLILPITVLILVPLWLEPRPQPAPALPLAAGIALVALGLSIMRATIAAFIRIGRGTLAPWSPTQKLVVTGLYAHVRNPMILGVVTVLLGEALAAGSWRILAWAAVFFVINTLYFVAFEEPSMERRFGEEYREYKRNVPRWVPRLRAWKSEGDEN